ncbi:sensor histidine kinase [Hyalangium rubrum]|uniref:histidine kinase n=1 Tax=Hyalangium rubrum TaxID=3103134 RepID=A0ABU5H750_9BACT|nr:ATP-binding protein [Hyalangium sp. s54d21]MDY7228952.1 ATP-binding protein [Hyalangium sp. s54d21]
MLFAGVALGLVVAIGAALYQSSSEAQTLRQRLRATGQRLSLYAEMSHSSWSYLERLLVARRAKQDTRQLLQEHEQIIRADFEQLRQGVLDEQLWVDVKSSPDELLQLETLAQARLQWARQVEEVVRPLDGQGPAPEAWWSLLAMYERQVYPQLAKAKGTQDEKMRRLQVLMNTSLERSQRLGRIIPLGASVLLGLLTVLILVPLHRELRKLRAGAERIGQGDFTVELPVGRKDELGALAQAFNRMTQELRGTLQQREQVMKAEAEAAERELRHHAEVAASDIRRYNTLLEQMVRTRTAELESSNAQLANSLRQLQAMQAQLMFTDRLAAMGRLAAGVGHEINNPLVYVITNINYLRTELARTDAPPSDEERKELLQAVEEAREGAERVRLIVQDLKTLSRPDDASNGTADLVAVVRSAAKIAAHEIRRRARLVEDFESVALVRGNAARLGQVFLNLLINAAHAIPEGKVEQNEIRVVARQESSERIIVEVRDTGCGIPAENLERIFDPFFTTKPSGQGTGLGLSLCHNIITALGGTITVESQLDQGTTFRVSLPAVKAERQARG